jgi:hypothetical protein
MDTLGVKDGVLAVFNRDTATNWDEKIYIRKEQINDRVITVVGL